MARKTLESDVELLEQFGRPFGNLTPSKEKKYSHAIGSFLMAFSYLETALDHLIISSISDRSDEPGYRIIKYLRFRDKTNLANDEYLQLISFIRDKRRKRGYNSKLNKTKKSLEELSEFRNKLAHANWESLTEKGFVRVGTFEDKEGGGVQFKTLKMTPGVINRFTNEVIKTANNIDEWFDNPSPLEFI
ncbi:hypothetical protein A3A40_03490 [Candidatus Kaiserbacteria bacterium RIFCSPLOWO2_01_FULL_54_20]|uniref:RiboL-PSP-HEPN domain-containing protein n=1 Tax=Candidatus Kaiserbacteria bacterium RIFCSPLOWO2_01_FULL_54_20 TaxID=1798513 RepID=A0A1F6EJY1_9BACT|nr:MAG: hypothetical protein A3A40_03490 [Candidatus Kaiserbacteria bacterium RIFCSPLOWO2_01_FULL_54_20]